MVSSVSTPSMCVSTRKMTVIPYMQHAINSDQVTTTACVMSAGLVMASRATTLTSVLVIHVRMGQG